MLNGIPLGHFAVKKIAVGDSPSYLMEILREVSVWAEDHTPLAYHPVSALLTIPLAWSREGAWSMFNQITWGVELFGALAHRPDRLLGTLSLFCPFNVCSQLLRHGMLCLLCHSFSQIFYHMLIAIRSDYMQNCTTGTSSPIIMHGLNPPDSQLSALLFQHSSKSIDNDVTRSFVRSTARYHRQSFAYS